MKIKTPILCIASVFLGVWLCALETSALEADLKSDSSKVTKSATSKGDAGKSVIADTTEDQDIERDSSPKQKRKQVTWLGLAAEEVSEALTSQLRLDPGVGLTVSYVTPDSPAAKAGLQKNDVLVEFDGQALVHPAQLRKLVQVRKEGDTAKLAYYRAGKKESASVTLSKTAERTAWLDGEQGWKDVQWPALEEKFRESFGDAFHQQMKNLRQSLGELRIETDQVQQEIRRSAEAARKAAGEAVRRATKDLKNFDPAVKVLEDLAHGGLGFNQDATVTINSSSGSSVKTMVKSDDTGTIVIVANPRKHLTVHDEAGKLLFDGEIETTEQKATVPSEIWEKVEPMVNKMQLEKDKRRKRESESDR